MQFTMIHENYNVSDLEASIAFYGLSLIHISEPTRRS